MSHRDARHVWGGWASRFVEAVDEMTPVYEALGAVIASAAKKDLFGNAEKLRRNGADDDGAHDGDASSSSPSFDGSLQALVRHDVARRNTTHPDSSAMALLWLKRVLEFTATVFDEIAQLPSPPPPPARAARELSDCVETGYWRHLGPVTHSVKF